MEFRQQKGITLVELVIVIVVLAIVSVIASIRMSQTSSITTSYQADLFASHLRHQQSLAINWGCQLNMNVVSTGYSVTSRLSYADKDCSVAGATIIDPATKELFSRLLTNQAQFSSAKSMGVDSLGRPIDAATGGLLTTDTVFTITSGGSWQVTVSPISGFVDVVKL